ncbi:type I glyceraldehyde-3-phosphate dehydrogenase [Larsenimonas suaedae]|uniref:Glyceraldehyde 3-phosphate dehydrogenase NAD-binding domain-containing protein n=1 Tax=Larsenimonas suaedae TaxID=1851019 RepID=A0ABU1GR13_9GAMM|nr:glyceraldehyde 3-phosphate dehydrogenase NAD-binding domain-containing protein [Larsenimonas suaedae]MCM2972735.1 erythrose-4-phosphate dehydrogenase [Larsenimonas suaedae]MDR5894468.1 glyceraldehyde 3-phosphate dehydrogenase NAD-binding domain-containing protein [Larsenimonas suaedae]
MRYRIAINGYGRIGRSVLRALFENRLDDRFEVVAINDLAAPDALAYLTRFDSTHGRFPGSVELEHGALMIDDHPPIRLLREPSVTLLPWASESIDLVFECSGYSSTREYGEQHLAAGAGKLLFSNPARDDVDATIIDGVNHDTLMPDARIVSTGSCTTNALIPILTELDRTFGVAHGATTTMHSAMNDQPVIDAANGNDLRRTRSALSSMVPVSTSLDIGIARLMPHLAGRFECLHIRVPTINVSMIDMAITLESDVDTATINACLEHAARTHLKGRLGFTDEPVASIDFNHDTRSSIVDGTQTRVAGKRLVKLVCWFDNEWGYANRMLDVAQRWVDLC